LFSNVYEPIDLTDKIMSQGASTPIEVAVMAKIWVKARHMRKK